MIRIPVQASAGRYDVLVGQGLLDSVGRLLHEGGLAASLRLVSDECVFRLYGAGLASSLRAEGFTISSYSIPPGEPSKRLETASSVYDWLVDTGTERRDVILALGGGVVGDLAGFVAATFLRGLRLVQLPTSLLAQVDSSVGGKVAVDHPRGKNLIGAFYPPSLVVADLNALASLPRLELSAALAEVVKMAAILDAELFERLERDADRLLRAEMDALEGVVARSVELKAEVVQADEKEAGLRAILNYGHTIGHGIEAATGYGTYRHGEAVALGMCGAALIAEHLGMLDRAAVLRQESLLRRFGLPISCVGVDVDRALEAMGHDKKASGGWLTWVLPEAIGRVVTRRDVPPELARQVLDALVNVRPVIPARAGILRQCNGLRPMDSRESGNDDEKTGTTNCESA